MKVFTTPQFNEAVKKLSSNDQQTVYRVFDLASKAAMKRSSLPLPNARVLIDKDDKKIYELRQSSIRVFSTIENIQGNESMVFIGLEKKTRNRSNYLSRIRGFNSKNQRLKR